MNDGIVVVVLAAAVAYGTPLLFAALGELLAAGVSSYRAALTAMQAVLVDVDPAAVRNVNSPGDLP